MILKKTKEYAKRYLLAEIAGVTFAIIASTSVFFFTQNKILAAFAATWGENIGYYLAILLKEIHHSRQKHFLEAQKYTLHSFSRNIRDIFLEFGPSEILDSFLVRPATMFFFTSFFANFQLGILVGKITADIIFYSFTILAYELRKKHLKH
ncbi:hypothetical protein KA119_02170 [Candidatus Gracilibacteria bacterium]|nr:hypothetical protein [Candidatus Gracilibacteria bacterium]